MDRENITHEQLDRLLGQLGFSRQIVPPKWIRYEHGESDTVIILADQKLAEHVRKPDWISARIHLVAKGLASEEELEKMLFPKPLPPKTQTRRKSKH